MTAASFSRLRRRMSVRMDCAAMLRGDVARGFMPPAGQHRVGRSSSGILRQRDEHALGHVVGEVWITHHSQCGGVNEIDVPADELGKSGFRPGFGEVVQQLRVGSGVHFPKSSRRTRNRTEKGCSASFGQFADISIGGWCGYDLVALR
jgi:hypothetical protein